MQSVLIIGGGAAGLMAAYKLSTQNKKVILLEASDRLGGRVHTYKDNKFSMPVELGAEFVHGKLPVTLNLLKQANIKYHAVKGKMIHMKNGRLIKQDNFDEHWDEVMKQMKSLKHDMPLSEFMLKFFNDDKYEKTRHSLKGYAEGFDLADISKASTTSLYNEWANEDHVQYRIDGGYIQLINFFESESKKNGCVIYNNCCVKKINWNKNEVNVITMCSRYFKADKIIITVPLNVLQAGKNDINFIEFSPVINDYLNAAKNIEFGSVIKIIMEFDEAFWKHQHNNTSFIRTDGAVPVWWTQLPNENPILTGWFGGLKATDKKGMPDEDLLSFSLESLGASFAMPVETLQKKLVAHKVVNWTNVEHIHGGYSYNSVNSIKAKKLLQQSIDNIIFFAGEAMYEGASEGTVEAALVSAENAVLQLNNIKD